MQRHQCLVASSPHIQYVMTIPYNNPHLIFLVGTFGPPASSTLPYVHNSTADGRHASPVVLYDASTLGLIARSPNHGPKQQAAAQGQLTQALPVGTISTLQAKHKYCCTLCGYDRPFKNPSDWKKHEKEHDTSYVCMLKGPKEATLQGTQCAFCGIPNPSDVHLLEHNTQACLQGPPDSFSSKRRHELVNHLKKIHSVHIKSQGEAIAVRWKHTVEKQAWSCGFCGITFVTFNDRLSHIATNHFELGQTIDQWDTTKVIQGLLQQLKMIKAWKEKMASLSLC